MRDCLQEFGDVIVKCTFLFIVLLSVEWFAECDSGFFCLSPGELFEKIWISRVDEA